MTAPSGSPTALKWWIASELRRLREDAGVSREVAAAAIKGSTQNLGHIEVGRSLPKPLELDKLLETYGVPERADLFQELRTRAKRGRDWWINLGDVVPQTLNLFLGLESSAVQIESWDALVVPGLFQTRATAEALIRVGRTDLDSDAIERLVDLRTARRVEVLDRDEPPTVWCVIAEPALRWVVGGREVLREQLEYLITLVERPNIDIQVLPFGVGAHVGTGGTFQILSPPLELREFPGCVFVEDRVQGYYYDEPQHLTRYRNDLTRLRVQAAKPEETAAYLQQLLKET